MCIRDRLSDEVVVVGEYPRAEVYMDTQAKVVRPSKRGKWQAGMLWVMYGKKSLSTTAGLVERVYYKCAAHSACKARLRIDLLRATGEKLGANATGTHNHEVQLAV
eukprot:TRINITY_DN52521_c0_g1_i1.p2 TRINITY_DN52521_c0_g1~~TRINITY_DN52521_c0_g1_i1.p2  ORF type:complete len:106 (+),score=27.74 TRINITY_DN52521_c0_g1_i1:104-421(+)